MSRANKMVVGAATILVLIVVLGVTAVIGGAFVAAISDVTEEERQADVEIAQSGDWTTFDEDGGFTGNVEQVHQVRDTTGYALEFSGDGYVESNEDVDLLGDDHWSVTTAVWIADEADLEQDSMTIVAIGDPNVLIRYDSGDWVAQMYDYEDSAEVSVEASDPLDRTHVTLVYDDGELTLFERHDAGEDASNTVHIEDDTPTSSSIGTENLVGTIDETRVLDDALNQTQRQSLYENPAGGVEGADETARLAYSEGDGDTTQVYWAGTTATIVNGEWTDGVEPTVLEEGEDYEIDTGDAQIMALQSGGLDHGAIAHFDYEMEVRHWAGPIEGYGNIAISLFAVGLLVVPAVVISVYLIRELPTDQFRRGRGR